jgi:hypothetical protein
MQSITSSLPFHPHQYPHNGSLHIMRFIRLSLSISLLCGFQMSYPVDHHQLGGSGTDSQYGYNNLYHHHNQGSGPPPPPGTNVHHHHHHQFDQPQYYSSGGGGGGGGGRGDMMEYNSSSGGGGVGNYPHHQQYPATSPMNELDNFTSLSTSLRHPSDPYYDSKVMKQKLLSVNVPESCV